MIIALYAHPFSSYSQKALIALYENATPFELKMLEPDTPQNCDALTKLCPIGKFPVLEDNGVVVFEATSIIDASCTPPSGTRLSDSDRSENRTRRADDGSRVR
jgi:glutathione S-transferase